MEIIISHKSALEYWRSHRKEKIADFARQRRKSLPDSLPSIAYICEKAPSELSYPLCLTVSSQNVKWKSTVFQTHVHTGVVPDGCFVSIGDGLAVSAPAFCFFQMASELPLIKLIELGFELCGTYSLPVINDSCDRQRNDRGDRQRNGRGDNHGNERSNRVEIADEYLFGQRELIVAHGLYSHGDRIVDNNLYGHPRLTSTKAITTLTARMEGVNGRKKASRALRYIANGSGSPMETILFMLLTLPHKLGGYGLPAPELNWRIDTVDSAKSKSRTGKNYYVCDLFWPDADIAVEYDSDFYHTGADRLAKDSRKRLALAEQGITVITVTSGQVRNPIEFERIAKLIAENLQKRLQYRNPQQFLKAKRELRSLLL